MTYVTRFMMREIFLPDGVFVLRCINADFIALHNVPHRENPAGAGLAW